jgi:hypothetical protein
VSSKKQLRRARREQAQVAKERARINPTILFIASIATLVLVLGVVAFVFRGEGPGAPPWPGAIWSEQHGHWH